MRGLQQGLRHRVRWAAQAHTGLSTRSSSSHALTARHNQRERAGPKSVNQALGKVGNVLRKMRHLRRAGHMHDERVVHWPALGSKNFCHRRVVTSVRAQAIDGLGGEGYKLTRLQLLGSKRYALCS